jgi:hypothetical protein
MSSHGNYDNSANAPYWAVNAGIAKNYPSHSAPTAANVAYLYGNTTSGVYLTDETIGLFMVDGNEEAVAEVGANHPVHTGWNLRTEGSGGRAGRVQWETLVALAQISSDNNTDDTTLPDSLITISAQPTSVQTVSAASAATLTYSVTAAVTAGASVPLSYQWQVNNNSGGSWVDIDPGTGVTTGQPGNMTKTGANTATLVVDPTGTTANNYVFRCKVFNTNAGATTYSANGRILITA